MNQSQKSQAKTVGLPKGAGTKTTKETHIMRPGRRVAGLGRRSQAPTPVAHDETRPAGVHRAPKEVDVEEIRAIRMGLYVRKADGTLERDANGAFVPKASGRPLDRAPAHSSAVASTLTKPESTKLG